MPLPFTQSELIANLRAGLPVEEIEVLRAGLNLPMAKVVPLLGMSKATWHRRKLLGRLDPAESDRVVRLARLLGKAIQVLESVATARLWLASRQVGLGGVAPLDTRKLKLARVKWRIFLGVLSTVFIPDAPRVAHRKTQARRHCLYRRGCVAHGWPMELLRFLGCLCEQHPVSGSLGDIGSSQPSSDSQLRDVWRPVR